MRRLLRLVSLAISDIIVVLLFQHLPTAKGQGLELPAAADTLGAAGAAYKQLEARYKRVQQIKTTFRASTKAQAATPCTDKQGFMCAANTADKESLQVLLMAASPDVFDARTDSFYSTNPISSPGDQGICNSCVGFAVAAAAEAAVANALAVQGSDVALSVQDLQFCEVDDKGNVELARLCGSAWNLLGALNKLKQQPPVRASCLQWRAPDIAEDALCSYCQQKEYDRYASQGSFTFSAVPDFADVQQAVRDGGGVATAVRVNIQHMRDFFAAQPKGIYTGSPANMSTEGHAVFVIGYSNPGKWWLVKNSFGTGFGDGGFMRIAYGTSGIMPPDQTFKLIFMLRRPPLRQLRVAADPSKKGCFCYTAQPKDHLARVAKAAGVPLQQLLLDNTDVVKDLDKPITGLQLRVCNPDPNRIAANGTNCMAVPAPAPVAKTSDPTPVPSMHPYLQHPQHYRGSMAWRIYYRFAPATACSKARGSLCADAGTDAVDDYARLLMAMSPWNYSSINPNQVGSVQLVAAPQDQQACLSVVAFAVAAAAETAMAAVLRVPVKDCSISVQSLFFCPVSGPTRTCFSSWDFRGALLELEQRSSSIPTTACLPYKPDIKRTMTHAELCQGPCYSTNKYANQGAFTSVSITSTWDAQRHIRQFGAVVTRLDVYEDFKLFFDNVDNARAVYKRLSHDTELLLSLAVVLVGYNNEEEYWIAKNSWGSDWADGGFFKVAFDCCGVLSPSDTYGIIWTPNQQPVPAAQLPVTSAAPQHPGCFWYKAGPTDYLSRVAWLAGIPLDQFMLDNTGIVKDLDAPLTGQQLLLCKPKPGTTRAARR